MRKNWKPLPVEQELGETAAVWIWIVYGFRKVKSIIDDIKLNDGNSKHNGTNR